MSEYALANLPLCAYVDALRAEGVLLDVTGCTPSANPPVAFATADSREVVPGTLFVCKGSAFKAEYLLKSCEAGAVAYVSEVAYPEAAAPCLLVSDVRKAMGVVADLLYRHPCGQTSVCAVTGTKGKTTTAYYLKGMLDARAARDGRHATPIFSSVLLDDGVSAGISKLTTPEPFELQRHLANAVSVGAREVVMEVSSQSLKYDRSYKVEFAVAAFTNIGEDHISPIEHPNWQDYFASKLKIFSQARRAVVNLDADHADEILAAAQTCERVVTCSMRDAGADVFLEDAVHVGQGILMHVRTPRFARAILVPTPAMFNIANALVAVAAAEAIDLDEESIAAGFEQVSVPGRMEVLPSASGKIVGIVDFAHNGMSLETLLRDLRSSYPDRELCVVFGATGGKGLDRRQTMGVVAGRLADRIVITEDDPGPEDVEEISATIARYVAEQGNANWQIINDREAAIRAAVSQTTRPAVVIVTGKGHETRMLRKGGAEPCEADGPMLRRALDEFAG